MGRIKIPILLLLLAACFFGASCAKTQPPKAEQKRPPIEAVAMPPPESPCKDRVHIVVAGESLSAIAVKQYFGRWYLYRLIEEANKDKLASGLRPGLELVIPCNICALAPVVVPASTPVVRKTARKPRAKSSKPSHARTVAVVVPEAPIPSTPPVKVTEPVEEPKPAPQVVETTVPAPAPPAMAPQTQSQSQSQTVIVNVPAPAPAATPAPEPSSTSIPEATPSPTETPRPPPPQAPEPPAIKPPEASSYAPGSLWNTGMTTPLEQGNFINYFHIDQGIVLGKMGKVEVEPYVAANAAKDTEGYQWNNRLILEAGLKFVVPMRKGFVAIGGAYASEWRAAAGNLPAVRKSAPIGFLDAWFGWQQPVSRSSKKKMFTGLPGSTWVRVGNVSPFERNNFIGMARLEQGVTAVKFAHLAFIPIGTLQATWDTDRNPWNNRVQYGGGLKIAIPMSKAAFDVQGGYECAKQYRGVPMAVGSSIPGARVCGWTGRVNLWTGWRKWGGE